MTLIENPFNEVVRKGTEISGARLVGFLAAPSGRPEGDAVEVAAAIPADWQGQPLCLKIVSADGLYESRNAYAVAPDWVGGRADLSYPSTHEKEALAYPGSQIAGLVSLGDCRQSLGQVAPIFWGRNVETGFAVLLNTARSDETFLTFPDQPDLEDVTCEATRSELRTAFDTRCDLPPGVVAMGTIEAVVVSFKNGEMGPEEHLSLRFGAAP
ncbi:hypothetical protein [Paenirhodobacter sp. CAU 1674]|uniref:hypothetical protein n=1 Tax=Paenirhodobacter sp. CAU 1674 TaxID=3032596 RepID=UPI0023D9982F|nr:hypothetical protein [Paenirhodobacter sp. CAU 1674]MDF2142932.1 hypothetical protein [Paenirhodobacter sp. CAU 1674]